MFVFYVFCVSFHKPSLPVRLGQTELIDRYCSSESLDALSHSSNIKEIGFHNAIFVWDATSNDNPDVSSDFSLSTSSTSQRKFRLPINGDVFFKRESLNLVLGPTGSGKTALLLALLGEMHLVPSDADSWYNLPRQDGVAYAPQSPWILNRTIRVGDGK